MQIAFSDLRIEVSRPDKSPSVTLKILARTLKPRLPDRNSGRLNE